MINKAHLMGYLSQVEPEVNFENKKLTNLYISTTRRFKKTNGSVKEMTNWHRVKCFNKLSDIAKKAKIGDLIYVEGEIQHRKEWVKGEEKWVYSIHAHEIRLTPHNNKQFKYSMLTA